MTHRKKTALAGLGENRIDSVAHGIAVAPRSQQSCESGCPECSWSP